MKALLDTCVLSELQKTNCNPTVKKIVAEYPVENVFISVITIGEIAKGIALLDKGKRQTQLLSWLNGLESHYANHILKTDVETSRLWGELTARAQKQGKQIAAGDGLIAATAIRHGLHVITRNVSDFEPTGAFLVNPWDGDCLDT